MVGTGLRGYLFLFFKRCLQNSQQLFSPDILIIFLPCTKDDMRKRLRELLSLKLKARNINVGNIQGTADGTGIVRNCNVENQFVINRKLGMINKLCTPTAVQEQEWCHKIDKT